MLGQHCHQIWYTGNQSSIADRLNKTFTDHFILKGTNIKQDDFWISNTPFSPYEWIKFCQLLKLENDIKAKVSYL